MTNFYHTVKGIFPGESWSITAHSTGTLTLAAANAAWVAAWTAVWSGVTTPNDNINQLIATNVSSVAAVTAILDPVTGKQTSNLTATLALAGTSASSTLPPQVSVALSFESSNPGKSGRGRMYLPVFATNAVTNGEISTAAQTILKLAGHNYLSSLKGSGLTPSLYNRSTKTMTPIVGGKVGSIFDTQRRRRNKLVEAYQVFS